MVCEAKSAINLKFLNTHKKQANAHKNRADTICTSPTSMISYEKIFCKLLHAHITKN